MSSTKTVLYGLLITLSIVGMVLVGIVAFLYSYSRLSLFECGVGFLVLLVAAGLLCLCRYRASPDVSPTRNGMLLFGMILGLLWTIEISINNFIAPPLPARDIIDNVFWSIIAFAILVFSVTHAYREDNFVRGMEVGIWTGFVSGLFACCTGLLVIVFGMHFILQDPLNVSEWAGHQTSSQAPTMAAYFAFETLAGAFGHLVILGVVMGGLLGLLGGGIAKGIKRITCLARKS